MNLITTNETFQNMSSNMSTSQSPSCLNHILADNPSKVIPVIYAIICIFGFIGNSVVITVLCRERGVKTIASIYILNLAVADLLFILTLPLWATYYAFGYKWVFGNVMCKLSGSLLCLSLFASIFIISCMSVDRYLAIVHPLRLQIRTSHQASVVVLIAWGLAILSTLPTLYFRSMYYIKSLGVNACVMDFSEEKYSSWFAAISLMKIGLGFCIPLVMIGTFYLRIMIHLKKERHQSFNRNYRDRALKIVTAIILTFIICWWPFHTLTFLDLLIRRDIICNNNLVIFIQTVMPFSVCLGFSNSSINPLLYCFFGNQFRENFKHTFSLKTFHPDSNMQSSSRKGSASKDEKCTGIGDNLNV
ncbi:type-2 angiotensin II receptor [Bombina bombina]|uniref:type-2 angiotensin II receptor n=1 Tax=Bombina bombina TaxID=8345 RepID=UPI00235A5C79|nr:type-2 angiotensin II receptor [Bombina bombina]